MHGGHFQDSTQSAGIGCVSQSGPLAGARRLTLIPGPIFPGLPFAILRLILLVAPSLRVWSMNDSADRDRIVEAALDEFSTQGFDKADLKNIAGRAQTSIGALFFHFPSKERIFLTLMDQFAASVERKVLAAVAERQGGQCRVEAALTACLDSFARYRRQTKILLGQAVGLGESFDTRRRELKARFAGHIQQVLDEAIAAGEIPPVDTEVVATAWMGAIYHLITTWVQTGEPSKERIRTTLVVMLLNSVEFGLDRRDHE